MGLQMTTKSNKAFFEGYREAVTDFGIYRDGVQVIGCLETPIKEVINRKYFELYPDCHSIDCGGCPGCMGIVNGGPLE